jgi:release factor glutamine methyltransferase
VTGPLLAQATARLADAGVGTPRVDAELLLAALLDLPRGRLITAAEPPASVQATFQEWVGRRVAREPLQHITGLAPFRHVELAVGPGVFVPRPETELLVDAVLPHLRSLDRPAVVDLCSGSGALALAIADEVPSASVIAVEYAQAALRWLTRNASGTSVRVVGGDIRDPELLRALYGQADVVVANPPYVPLPTDVSPEVLADPRDAVFAGSDGLDLIPTVISRAAMLLRSGGQFAIEHDDTHGEQVPRLLAADGNWQAVRAHHDLAGYPRYAVATRR